MCQVSVGINEGYRHALVNQVCCSFGNKVAFPHTRKTHDLHMGFELFSTEAVRIQKRPDSFITNSKCGGRHKHKDSKYRSEVLKIDQNSVREICLLTLEL